MLGSPIPYLNGMRTILFQLSGFYCRVWGWRFGSGFGLQVYRAPKEHISKNKDRDIPCKSPEAQ